MEKLDRKFRRPRHSVTEWSVLSRCSREYEWTVIRPKPTPPSPDAELGTRVHAALRLRDRAQMHKDLLGLEAAFGSERMNAQKIFEWVQGSEWMQDSREGTWNELAFEVPVLGEVVVGAMDRVVQRGGQWAVLDFKIVRRQKSGDAFQDWIESYTLQMELYLWALRELEPKAAHARAVLVEMSPEGVRTHRLDCQAATPSKLEELVGLARGVIAEGGRPRASQNCRNCSVRNDCPEGRAQVQFL